jgi:uncharacterized membrane protein
MSFVKHAVASGACAAVTGVFAKLTTTFHSSSSSSLLLYIERAIFLLLNVAFNSVMWILFTKALRNSTNSVSPMLINTATNFIATAVFGWLLFDEQLSVQWCIGAALMVAGNYLVSTSSASDKQPKVDS